MFVSHAPLDHFPSKLSVENILSWVQLLVEKNTHTHTHTAVGPGCALTMSWWVLGASVSPNHTVLQQVRQEVSGTSGGPEDMVLSMSVTT